PGSGFTITMPPSSDANILPLTGVRQTKPQQRPQESGLHGVGRPVPCPRQNGRLRDGTQPRAMVAEPSGFRSGREFAAWLGLVPRQNSTGGKNRLGGISKRGNQYLRRLLINGASANLL